MQFNKWQNAEVNANAKKLSEKTVKGIIGPENQDLFVLRGEKKHRFGGDDIVVCMKNVFSC